MTLQEWGGGLTVNGEFCPMGYHDILSFPLLPTPNRFLSVQVYKICIHNFQEINVHIYMIGFACNSQIPHARQEVTLQEVGGGVLTVNGKLYPILPTPPQIDFSQYRYIRYAFTTFRKSTCISKQPLTGAQILTVVYCWHDRFCMQLADPHARRSKGWSITICNSTKRYLSHERNVTQTNVKKSQGRSSLLQHFPAESENCMQHRSC